MTSILGNGHTLIVAISSLWQCIGPLHYYDHSFLIAQSSYLIIHIILGVQVMSYTHLVSTVPNTQLPLIEACLLGPHYFVWAPNPIWWLTSVECKKRGKQASEALVWLSMESVTSLALWLGKGLAALQHGKGYRWRHSSAVRGFIPALPLSGYTALGKAKAFCFLFPHVETVNTNNTHLIGPLGGLKTQCMEVIGKEQSSINISCFDSPFLHLSSFAVAYSFEWLFD